MFHIESAFEFYKMYYAIYMYIFTNFISIFMANIFFKSFCHVNKQCLLLHEKIRRSKAHDKKRNFLQYITKNIVTSTHCAFEGWRVFKVMTPSMWYLDDNRWVAGSTTTNC